MENNLNILPHSFLGFSKERPEQCDQFYMKRRFIQRASTRKKVQPWERIGDSTQVGNEKAQTGVHLPPGSWRGHVQEDGGP